MNDLVALSVIGPVNYGTLLPGQNTGTLNATTTVTSTGNVSLDIILHGVDMVSGGNTIAVINQEYTTSSVAYGTGTDLQLSPGIELEFNLAKTTSNTIPAGNNVFLGAWYS